MRETNEAGMTERVDERVLEAMRRQKIRTPERRGQDGFYYYKSGRGVYAYIGGIGDDREGPRLDFSWWLFGDSIPDMTALVAILTHDEVVVVSDGGRTERCVDDSNDLNLRGLNAENPHCIKSVALSRDVCIAFAGPEGTVLDVFHDLVSCFCGEPSPNTLEDWERQPLPFTAPLADVREWISSRLARMKAEASAEGNADIRIGIILAGKDAGELTACVWKKKTEWKTFPLRETAMCEESRPLAVLPCLEQRLDREAIDFLLEWPAETAETRAVEAIRRIAGICSDAVGTSVLVRSSRDGFITQWDEPTASSPMRWCSIPPQDN